MGQINICTIVECYWLYTISMNLFHLWSSYIFMRKISLFLWCFTYYIGVKYKLLQNYKSPVCHIIKGGHWISLKQVSPFLGQKLQRGQSNSWDNGESTHKPAGLVQVGNLETHAHVPSKMSKKENVLKKWYHIPDNS